MNVLLVQPPLTLISEVNPPLGLCMLAAHVRRAGHSVRILDLDLEDKVRPGPGETYLDTFADVLRGEHPAVVGFTSMFNNSLHAERLIGAAKRFDDGIATIAGGSHFGALPRRSLERIPELDFVVRGEGETAFATLLGALETGTATASIPGLCQRTPDGIVENPAGPLLDLALVPPVWSSLAGVIDLRRYVATIPAGDARRTIYTEAGRGCPFACSFCATAPFWQRRYRVRPAETIVAEMRDLYETHGFDTFMLVHDLLTADRRFVDGFCDAMFSANLPVEWTANHRADIALGDLAGKMRRSGCTSVFMGIESASERIQDDVHKGLTREEITSTVRTLRNVGITSTCSFIIGFPSESTSDLSATLALACELKMLGAEPVQFHRLRMWPPAPLTTLGLAATFDPDALRLEYPAVEIPAEDFAIIEADPAFFAGYFTTHSTVGSAYQLAQLELFFGRAVATVPLTMGTLATIHGDGAVRAFYDTLDAHGPLTRDGFDSAASILRQLVPFLHLWIEREDSLANWQRALLAGVLEYERTRGRFIADGEVDAADLIAAGARWGVFGTTVDLAELLNRLSSAEPLSADLVHDGCIALSRGTDGAIRGFVVSEGAAAEMRDGDRRLAGLLETG